MVNNFDSYKEPSGAAESDMEFQSYTNTADSNDRSSKASDMKVTLIDLGMSTKFSFSKNDKMYHTKEKQVETFRGNLSFASKYQMEFITISRRDDMISLFYNLIILLNNFKFPLLVTDKFDAFGDNSHNLRETFLGILQHKIDVSLYKMT